ncbi:MAG: hypothetical protein NTW86_18190 [Candidatus Sumerlaeota bacterium]|nr:hypothetical protein [Candidatus Sumerlaeota bacterium]
MGQPPNREQLMMELKQLDEQIDGLVKQMPSVSSINVPPFPWSLWGVAIVLGAVYGNASGLLYKPLLPSLSDYSRYILYASGLAVLLAAWVSVQTVLQRLTVRPGRFHKEAAKVDALKKRRDALARQLR